MALTYKEYSLSKNSIEAISAELQAYLNNLNMERQNIQRIRLTVEEILLNIMEHCEEGTGISFGVGRRFGKYLLRLRYTADPFDPTETKEDYWSEDIMKILGFSPVWNHRGSVNSVSMVLVERKKKSTIFYPVLALLLAVILGVAGRMLPETFRQNAGDIFLTPLGNSFLGLLKTFSSIMILFTICSGIAGLGRMETLGRIGRSVMLRTMLFSVTVCIGAVIVVQPFLHPEYINEMQGDSEQLKAVSRMLFDILPSDPVEPFRNGNFIQIIVIALFLGMGLLVIGEKGTHLRGFVDDSALLTQHILSAISAFVPLFIFVMVLQQIWLGKADTLISAWKPLVLINGSYIVLAVIMLLISALHLKFSPGKLIKKVIHPFIIGFTTASSLSAMAISMDTCEKKFGVQKKIVSFLYPLDSMVYKPFCILYYTIIAFTLSEMYKVEISLPWVLTAGVLSILLSVASPPISGSGLMVYTILFSSLGLPPEAIVVAATFELISDHLYTGLTIVLQIFHIACEANRMGYLDRAVFEQNHV